MYIIPRPVKFTLRIKKFVEKMNQFPADTEILEWYLNFLKKLFAQYFNFACDYLL